MGSAKAFYKLIASFSWKLEKKIILLVYYLPVHAPDVGKFFGASYGPKFSD